MSNTPTFMPNNLRSRRKEAGLLQSDVARALGLDCADRISHWENGTAMPNLVNLFKLAAIYGVKPHELYPELYNLVGKDINLGSVGDESCSAVQPSMS